MTITRLVRGVRNAQKIAIYIDSKYTFSVLENIVIDENLFIGKEISKKELDRLQNLAKNKELINKVINLVSLRPRSEKEITQYLGRKIDNDELSELIEELKEKGHIDDTKFALWWIDQRTTFRNKSVNEIKSELLKKGIRNDIIEESLEQSGLEDNELESAKNLAEKKKKSLTHKKLTNEQMSVKIQQYLLGKGFRWEIINKALEE